LTQGEYDRLQNNKTEEVIKKKCQKPKPLKRP
jgi:hypothetical protein